VRKISLKSGRGKKSPIKRWLGAERESGRAILLGEKGSGG